MLEQLIHLDKSSDDNLKQQIRKALAVAILDGHIPLDKPIPSSRKLSQALSVSRQTVMFAYEDLVEDGYIIARERRGYFVNPSILDGRAKLDNRREVASKSDQTEQSEIDSRAPDWSDRFASHPSQQRNIDKPSDWQRYEYPFLSGQIDPKTFPLAEWRECSKQALSVLAVRDWTGDCMDADDPILIEQIRSRVLPRRGIWAKPEEILITVGTQHSLYLLSTLLAKPGRKMAMENPGYPDARNIFSLHFGETVPQPVDNYGLVLGDSLRECDYVYTTPSHHWPTSVTMPIERRKELLALAEEDDLVIIEDDYEIETNYIDDPLPALKSLDSSGRVIYMSSLSKVLAPGLRIGFMVAPAPLIEEVRVLRRLMMRHPPMNNQRMTALFLARGHYDALLKRLWRKYKRNWSKITRAIERYIPSNQQRPVFGGTTCWVRGPEGLDCHELRRVAAERGILLELGDIAFNERADGQGEPPPKNYFRLGFTVIPEDKIEPGIQLIAELIEELTGVGH
ncbi:PLP-dependent aminotransferase family protein [Pseudomaricurvus sp.]|uniref:MocR-like pyridoxine biosynthesis transcription factor PdxR n=1 Tax=Pseudomaricurvus sp. TaxID=2004510 RepID=UPI003F6B5CDA